MFVIGSTAHNLSPQLNAAESIRIRVPATGGELWQGFVGERLVMVNSPISYYGEVVLTKRPEAKDVDGPSDSQLIKQAAIMVLSDLGMDRGLEVRLATPVPRGLGMASSTTELAATAYGVARLFARDRRQALEIAHRTVCRFDSGNDLNYLPGVHLVDPRRGIALSSFAEVPRLQMILVTTGGRLDTAAMDRDLERAVGKRTRQRMEESLARMMRGLALQDLSLIGQAATENAQIYQEITYKPHLEDALELIKRHRDCVGIACGHSGTVIGVLAYRGRSLAQLKGDLGVLYGRENVLGEYALTSGGIHEHFGLS